MLNKFHEKQQGMELIILEQLVPQDHLLRKIDRSIDFSFIRRLCAPLYSANLGRPAIEPEVLFRMLFVGYLYGIRSERRLEEEINYNMAYKWFCGLHLTEKAPDATTLSVNRKRRFRDNNIPEQIFNEILRQAMEKGLVGGTILYTDSTHVKAKANKHKKTTVVVERTPKAYLEELDEAIERDRKELGKKLFDKKDDDDPPPTREVQQSKSDPESGQLHKEGKPDGFHYSEHRTVDSKHNIVVNVRITPANVNDVEPIAEILKDIDKRLGKQPKYMGLDAGYHNAPVCHQLAAAGIQPVVGYRRHTHKGDYFGKYRFTYDPVKNVYLCPQGHELTWRTTNREGYREYWSEPKTCRDCPRRAKCFSAKSSRRQVTRHVWQDALEQADAFGKTSSGKRIYAWRKETIERSFAEAKELHGLRYARMLGIRNMYEQSFLTAAAQNMKRIARAFRSLFSVLLYALRGCFPKKAAPLSAVCARRPMGRRASFLFSTQPRGGLHGHVDTHLGHALADAHLHAGVHPRVAHLLHHAADGVDVQPIVADERLHMPAARQWHRHAGQHVADQPFRIRHGQPFFDHMPEHAQPPLDARHAQKRLRIAFAQAALAQQRRRFIAQVQQAQLFADGGGRAPDAGGQFPGFHAGGQQRAVFLRLVQIMQAAAHQLIQQPRHPPFQAFRGAGDGVHTKLPCIPHAPQGVEAPYQRVAPVRALGQYHRAVGRALRACFPGFHNLTDGYPSYLIGRRLHLTASFAQRIGRAWRPLMPSPLTCGASRARPCLCHSSRAGRFPARRAVEPFATK